MSVLDTSYYDKDLGWCFVELDGTIVDGYTREDEAKRGFADYLKEELRKKRCPTCEE